MVNDKYTERERLSMALWDSLCEMVPATKEERDGNYGIPGSG